MGLISMENERYKRNNIYINETEQNLIAQTKILPHTPKKKKAQLPLG